MSLRRFFPVLAGALALAISALYLAPSLLSRSARYFPVGSGGDGAFYAMKLKGAMEGDTNLSCVQDPSLRSADSFLPRAAEGMLGRALRATVGPDIVQAHRWIYGLLPPLIFLLLLGALYGLTRMPALSLGIAFWAMLEPATYYWKPWSWAPLSAGEWEFPYFRYANPLLMAIPLLVFLAAFLNAMPVDGVGARPRRVLWVVAGVALGAMFYTQVFYWSWAGLALLLFYALAPRAPYRGGLLLVGAGGLALGLPELWNSLQLQRDPLVQEVLHRGGCLIASHHAHFWFHRAFLLTFALYQALSWKRWDWRWRFLTASMVAGWLALNQNALTGLSNQDHHYFRPLTEVYALVVADAVRRLAGRLPRARAWFSRHAGPVLACFVLAVGAQGAHLSRTITGEFDGPGSQGFKAERFARTLELIRTRNLAAPGSALSNPDLTYVIRLIAGTPVYVHDYLHHCLFSDAELYARWGFLLRVFGKGPAEYSSLLRENAERTEIQWWLFGLPRSYRGARDHNERVDLERMAEACVADYAGRDLASYAEELGAAHGLPRYVLESPGFAVDFAAVGTRFRLILVGQVPEEKTRLYELASRSDGR